MHEVDVDAIDLGPKLRKVVEPGLLGAPVKGVPPVVYQLFGVNLSNLALCTLSHCHMQKRKLLTVLSRDNGSAPSFVGYGFI
jgi:hypothetical protein